MNDNREEISLKVARLLQNVSDNDSEMEENGNGDNLEDLEEVDTVDSNVMKKIVFSPAQDAFFQEVDKLVLSCNPTHSQGPNGIPTNLSEDQKSMNFNYLNFNGANHLTFRVNIPAQSTNIDLYYRKAIHYLFPKIQQCPITAGCRGTMTSHGWLPPRVVHSKN